MGDWPIKEYLKHHFRNQWNYQCHLGQSAKDAACPLGKNLDAYVMDINDIFDFGSASKGSSDTDSYSTSSRNVKTVASGSM